MNTRDCMSAGVRVISPDTTLIEAARMMRDGDFGAIPVGANDRLLGMVTDRDITVCAVAHGKDVQTTKVRDVMSDEVIHCFEDDSLEVAAQKMAERQVRRLMVLNKDKRFVGIIALGDIADAQRDQSAHALAGVSEQDHREPARH